MAQKPKRVGQLANVGAKVRNKNETAKLFGNFLSFNNVFVKPNEQNKARFNSVMARKGAIKWKLSLPTVVREVKRQ